MNEQHEVWGLSADEYAKAKWKAREERLPLGDCLNAMRMDRGLPPRPVLTAIAEQATIGTEAA